MNNQKDLNIGFCHFDLFEIWTLVFGIYDLVSNNRYNHILEIYIT